MVWIVHTVWLLHPRTGLLVNLLLRISQRMPCSLELGM